MTRALEGIRVLDLSRMLPGPYASMVLADLGAHVIKIEDTQRGDPTRWSSRHRSDGNSTFFTLNRGKRSLALNLKSPDGVEIFRKLVRGTDVLLEGFRPGVMERLGLGFAALRKLEPRLVFCSISGYGQEGPRRERSGHDVNYLALSGVLGLQTDGEGSPVLSGIQVADLGGALFAVIGILAALAGRERTGEGQQVDVSMMDVGVALLPVAASWLFAGDTVPIGARLPLSGGLACYNIYGTADGRHLSVGALEPKFWERFCSVIGREELVPLQTDEKAQPAMTDAVRRIIKTRSLREWEELFAQTDACVEPVLSLEEAFGSPQVRHRRMISESTGTEHGGVRQLNLPFKLSETPAAPGGAAPRLGEHTREILLSLDYSSTEIDRLAREGVVAVS